MVGAQPPGDRLSGPSPSGPAGDPAFGRFRLEAELARQPGRVSYRAVDLDDGGIVALKVIDLVGDRAGRALLARRFERETAVLRALRHPGIVRIVGAGSGAFAGSDAASSAERKGPGIERAWVATRFVEGGELLGWLARPGGGTRAQRALRAASQATAALAHAHRHGVLHRDVKPANVLVEHAGGQVVLADFGLAAWHDAARTQTGLLPGTPTYMAPEVLAGAAPSVAADVYSLGATIYHALTGRPPHRGATLGELFQAVARQPVAPASTEVPGLPGEVDRLLQDCLASTPARRPRHLGELSQAFADLAQRLPQPPA